MTTTTAQNQLSDNHTFWLAIGLVALAVVIVTLPLLLARCYTRRGRQASFFDLDYSTWFVIHFCIPALAIVAIVVLAIDKVIDNSTVAALLGSLFGYVLGSSAHGSRAATGNPPTALGAGGQPKGAGQTEQDV